MSTFSFKNSIMVTVCALLFLLQLSAAVPQYYGGYGGYRGGYGGYGGYGGGHYHDAIVDHGDHHHHVPLHCDTFHYNCHVGK